MNSTAVVNCEVRFYEDNSRIEFIYGSVLNDGTGATVGIQPAVGSPTQFECNTGGITSGLKLTFVPNGNTICASGAANPASVSNCGDAGTLLTVAVTPTSPPGTGVVVAADLSGIGGSASQAMYDDGTHGDAVAGDRTFSYRAVVADTT